MDPCDLEVSGIVKLAAEEDEPINDPRMDISERKPEPEIVRAAELEANLQDLPSLLQTKLNPSSQEHSPPGGSGSASYKSSRNESPVTKPDPPGESCSRLKLGAFSGINSRKGSSCSTPVSNLRSELDYPSPNFVRPSLVNLEDSCHGVSIDENSRLTIRLHYNPVMDEWVSLTDESLQQSEVNTHDLDTLFDLYKRIETINDAETEVIMVRHFLNALATTGIRRTDPRLKVMMSNLNDIKNREFSDTHVDSLLLNRTQFKSVVDDNIALLSRAFKSQFVIPEFEHFTKQIKGIYNHCKNIDAGEVASYIPQLARYDPNYFGVSICTVDGQRFSLGDVNIPFTMQSTSKPFTYAVCLNELGRDVVHSYVGQEPSGRMFNELTLDNNNKPHNPLLNSGAIMSASILLGLVNQEMKMSEKFDFVSDYIKRIAGGEFLSFNNSVFLSEKETADRNYALTYYMRENNCFPKGFNLQDCLDFYFQTCSMEVNCDSIAVMGASLANGGVCPITNEEVLKPESVRDVLSLMHSCGMYNYSGQFAFNVGLPAKSGVSGALVLVIPNVMGIGVWSPPLDSLGNTVRGVQFAKELVKHFNFHRFDNLINLSGRKVDPRVFKDEQSRQSTLCLLYSATTGDLTALKRFYYNSNTNMNASNYDGRTALHLACAEGHLNCVQFLVETCKANPLLRDRWGFTPVIEAKRFRHEKVVQYLLKYLEEHYPAKSDNTPGFISA
eukprot:maker-scaffold22_size673200-snap-gene-4.21 protein:Tk12686 transcript:maker-scaffold22_size673200-snap-gene-4.21-mRNA-1 annotation:"hypothetical protein DAPPUDRAFT_320441"